MEIIHDLMKRAAVTLLSVQILRCELLTEKMCLPVILRLQEAELFFDSLAIFCYCEFDGLSRLRRSLKFNKDHRLKNNSQDFFKDIAVSWQIKLSNKQFGIYLYKKFCGKWTNREL